MENKKITQIKWVATQLAKNGSITRNQCLQNYISRLASLMKKIEAKGFHYTADYIPVETQWGRTKDYQYKVNPMVQENIRLALEKGII